MLLGQSRNNLDSKGRIFVPVKWRPDTSDHVVVLIGLNPADVKKEERFLPPPLFPGNRKRAPKPKLQRSEINRTLTGCQKAAAS